MITLRPSAERGQTEAGWLHSRHTFSFGEYHNPEHHHFGSLRVLNDDIVEPGRGFGTHSHENAEIFSYVIEGALAHRDSMGNGSTIQAGNLQYMSAGAGVRHSEFNPSETDPVHFLQIWLLPNVRGGEPRYAEKELGDKAKLNVLTLLFSLEGRDGSIAIRQNADIFLGKGEAGFTFSLQPGGRKVWLHLISGKVEVLGESLQPGDSAGISGENEFALKTMGTCEFLLFYLKEATSS